MPEDIEVLIAAAKPQPKGATSSSKPGWAESDTEKLLDRLEKGKRKR